MRKTLFKNLTRGVLAAFALLSLTSAAPAQTGAQAAPAADKAKPAAPSKPDEKAEAILKRAIEALGGGAYLGARTQVSHGYYTPYRDGAQGIPIKFADYIAFPDRERTEFKGSGILSVQTNTGETGWLFDGRTSAGKVSDITPEQAAEFRILMRTSLDNVLRGWWRADGATLSYVGRREAGLAKRNEVVRVAYPDGFQVEFEFGAQDGLPNKILFKKQNKEGELVEEEYRLAQYLPVGGARLPHVVDHYVAGSQVSRANYDTIEFNRELPVSFFEKPTDIKAFLKSLK